MGRKASSAASMRLKPTWKFSRENFVRKKKKKKKKKEWGVGWVEWRKEMKRWRIGLVAFFHRLLKPFVGVFSQLRCWERFTRRQGSWAVTVCFFKINLDRLFCSGPGNGDFVRMTGRPRWIVLIPAGKGVRDGINFFFFLFPVYQKDFFLFFFFFSKLKRKNVRGCLVVLF